MGRQDTGDPEAQIRGSRQAWDIRLISVDALLRLVQVKEAAREYTRVDSIIDVVFSASEDEKLADELDKTDGSGEGKQFVPVSFHEACLPPLQQELSVRLVKQTRSTYASPDGRTGVVCCISRKHEAPNGELFWFACHPSYGEFLRGRYSAHVAFGCGSERNLVLLPYAIFEPLLPSMNTTRKDDRMYWHVKILGAGGQLTMYRKPGFPHLDLSPCRLSRRQR